MTDGPEEMVGAGHRSPLWSGAKPLVVAAVVVLGMAIAWGLVASGAWSLPVGAGAYGLAPIAGALVARKAEPDPRALVLASVLLSSSVFAPLMWTSPTVWAGHNLRFLGTAAVLNLSLGLSMRRWWGVTGGRRVAVSVMLSLGSLLAAAT